ncbi:serine hydrolase domain-containing protein [Pseudobacteriovorax antillogorgiicola]|uniref:CubicO group peptidase, beta-lactamase class C family n=1 Tax=Pseudobacteriovorax antillogorgiicola TaxID=1513793 RepID=A0A1Y6BFJ2_9BACT|nr:serine hydrolase domain-containing protein [Pseudobacteriovorax antillogorgiicola]TCS56228.1 CubicO group peptidase (beta-lactamase class C family) [Pseudobacteriovorax antillogorgiicola]SMF08285.1 CubicO group peptidase, beta-lactamase class C family [Pseudobacteriovorax antillogorgiicola]
MSYCRFLGLLCLFLVSGPLSAQLEINRDGIQAELEEYNFFSQAPGTVLSICLMDECQEFSAGVKDPAGDESIAIDSLFRIGSLTKTMVAVLTLQLLEDGVIALNDPLSMHLPQFGGWGEVTIRQLMQMRSGVPAYLFRPEALFSVLGDVFKHKKVVYDPNQLLNDIKGRELDFTPGTASAYNNTNYVLLGLILEKYRGQKLETILAEGIAEPLGLKNTYLDMSTEDDPQLTRGFLQSHFSGLPSWLNLLLPKELRRGWDTIDITNGFPASRAWAAGGVVSSPREMNTFIRGLMNGKLISDHSLAQMIAVREGNILGNPVQYGLGIMKEQTPYGDFYGHGGVGVGYQNMTYYSPEHDLGVVVTQNVGPAATGSIFVSLITKIFEGKAVKPFDARRNEIPDWFWNGLHLKVKGNINPMASEDDDSENKDKSLFGPTVGYAYDKRRFVPGQSFNNFSSTYVKADDQDYIQLTAFSQTAVGGFLSPESLSFPVTMIYLKRDRLISYEDENKKVVIEKDLDLSSTPVFVFVGEVRFDQSSGSVYTCASRLLDTGREMAFQFSGNFEESYGTGESIKMLGNFPLRNVSWLWDQDLLSLFGLNRCPIFG